jgi:hypothetical protein
MGYGCYSYTANVLPFNFKNADLLKIFLLPSGAEPPKILSKLTSKNESDNEE